MKKPLTYEIVISGRASERILGPLIDDFAVDHPVGGQSRLVGVVRDAAHLHGVIAYLTSIAAEIISVTPTNHAIYQPIDQPTNSNERQEL